jgi:hypothetical protein
MTTGTGEIQKTEFRSQNCGLKPLLLDSFFKPDLQAHDVRNTSDFEILTPEFCFLNSVFCLLISALIPSLLFPSIFSSPRSVANS